MCGRFALQASAVEMHDFLGEAMPELYTPRYNIAPTAPVLAKTDQAVTFFSWGLVPSWSKDVNIGSRMFNARAETVAEKPSFRNAFRRRRCLVPASGFYEWQAQDGGKQPYFFHLAQRPLFCFAGIWEHWSDAMGNELQSCSILTREARGSMQAVHHRMPVVLDPGQYATWLDHQDEDTDRAQQCIAHSVEDFDYYAVSRRVNSARNEGPELVERLEQGG